MRKAEGAPRSSLVASTTPAPNTKKVTGRRYVSSVWSPCRRASSTASRNPSRFSRSAASSRTRCRSRSPRSCRSLRAAPAVRRACAPRLSRCRSSFSSRWPMRDAMVESMVDIWMPAGVGWGRW